MRRPQLRFRFEIFIFCVAVTLLTALRSGAQSCTSQSEMDAATRNGIKSIALATAQGIASTGDSAVSGKIAPQVASDAAGILASISGAAPLLRGANFVVEQVYLLDATNLSSGSSSAQFFCGSPDGSTHVVFSLGSLPSAIYAIAMLHAASIAHPQQVTIIFARPAGREGGGAANAWKVAGFAYKPLTMAGHDGVWYWQQARIYAKAKQNWDAYFYYEAARSLVVPVDFLSSSNLNKLIREENAVKPPGLPAQQPMELANGAQNFEITNLHVDAYLEGLDIVVHYRATSVADPAATRQQNIKVMQLLVQAHPELRKAFHGIWVYAVAPGQDPFEIELPMTQVP